MPDPSRPDPTYRAGDLAGRLAGPARGRPVEPLPLSAREMRQRGWDAADMVFVTGDAYVDHPSFAMAVLGRVLEAAGFRVGIVSQPDWRSCDDWRRFGRPRLFFAVSAGNMDSMINHYTAARKVRNADAYSPGGRIGTRPDRATLAYCQRAREAYAGVPVVAGGVEASLRRLAHYDYWSDKVRPSILLDCKADLLVFGMGEDAIVEIADRLDAGQTPRDLRDMRGVAYALGASEEPPADALVLPSFERVRDEKAAFAEATRRIHGEINPHNARRLLQPHGRRAVVCNPPRLPLSTAAMDAVYALPYTRRPHPAYRESIPAFEMIRDSITIMRGCFGGCSFCSISAHQGRGIQSRSEQSIMQEVRELAADRRFRGVISDIGGPTANMYRMGCSRPEGEAVCRRQSCLHPKICRLLDTGHDPLIRLMKAVRESPGVRKALVASGVRMDLALRAPLYVRDLARHHVGGQLSVAPEHAGPEVLALMRKPAKEDFERFSALFGAESKRAGKQQYLVPYFIAGHPGSDLDSMIDLALFLKRSGHRPEQVQDFIPAPFDVATAMYHTGIDPFTRKPVHVARHPRERRQQRALMQFFKPENHAAVRRALIEAGRGDLIGHGADALVPPAPAGGAARGRRREGAGASGGERGRASSRKRTKKQAKRESRHAPGRGYRPGRASAGKGERRHGEK